MARINGNDNPVAAVHKLYSDAANVSRLLKKGQFNIKKLAIIGRAHPTGDRVVDFYATGNRVKHWGTNNALWGGLWSMLLASAFFLIPGIDLVAVAGSAVAWIVGALESAAVIAGLSVLGAELNTIGISKLSAFGYESFVEPGKFLLIAHETTDKAEAARRILADTSSEETNVREWEQPAVAA